MPFRRGIARSSRTTSGARRSASATRLGAVAPPSRPPRCARPARSSAAVPSRISRWSSAIEHARERILPAHLSGRSMVISRVLDEDRGTCASGGLAGRLPPEVAAGLGAQPVARALNAPGTLDELGAHALEEMRSALGLAAAVLYLPEARMAGRSCAATWRTSPPTPEWPRARSSCSRRRRGAWRSRARIRWSSRSRASWVVANPFEPQARQWLALPMVAAGELLGVVIAARSAPINLDLDHAHGAHAAWATSSPPASPPRACASSIQHAELERERMRLAAEVHDGLAQDLALAKRELALLESDPPPEAARASQARLREAVAAAHRLVRARLIDLSTTRRSAGCGPRWRTSATLCAARAERGDRGAGGSLRGLRPPPPRW